MASTYLTRTPSSTTNRKTFTWSGWIKRSQLGATNTLFTSGYSSNAVASLRFNASNKLDVFDYNSSTQFAVVTNRLFRDTSAWYHIVMRVDTTQSTANDRVRLYVNGEQETSLTTNTQPSQNYDTLYNGGIDYYIGRYGWTNPDSFNGSMSHIHFCDGQSYAPTEFGETDATTGEWKIKTSPSVTYGTNGFWILKDGNSVTDQSGNSNNFTVAGGTLTKTEDSPSNVFAVVNSLSTGSGAEFAYGNTRVRKDTIGFLSSLGTIACGLGKYYWEVYRYGGGGNLNVGICLAEKDGTTQSAVDAGRVIYTSDGYIIETGIGGGQSNLGITFGDADIIGIALDTENGILNFYKNGTLVKTITSTALLHSNNEFVPAWQLANGGEARNNFGNGYFGTTAVSSAGINLSGNGIFEYDVPTGFTALSTKGLNL